MFRIGDTVTHSVFGQGEVVQIALSCKHPVRVQFEELMYAFTQDGVWSNQKHQTLFKVNQDTVVRRVVDKFHTRSEVGFKKYGTNLDRTDLTLLQWMKHLQEELMDATVYLEKIMEDDRIFRK